MFLFLLSAAYGTLPDFKIVSDESIYAEEGGVAEHMFSQGCSELQKLRLEKRNVPGIWKNTTGNF